MKADHGKCTRHFQQSDKITETNYMHFGNLILFIRLQTGVRLLRAAEGPLLPGLMIVLLSAVSANLVRTGLSVS